MKEEVGTGKADKKKEGGVKKESKSEVKVEAEPEDLISLVKSRRLMTMQAKKEKEEMDRQNKGKLVCRPVAWLYCPPVVTKWGRPGHQQ